MAARSRRVLRGVVRGLIGLLVVVLIALALFAFMAPLRNRILPVVLNQVDKALPGSLTVETATWPSLARLQLEGLVWVDDADTLLVAEHLLVDARLRPLLKKDLVVRSIQALGIRTDLPALMARFPATEPDSEPAPPDAAIDGSVPFLRDGSVRGLPSVAIEELRLHAERVVLPDSSTLRDVRAELTAQALAGSAPRLVIHELRARSPEQAWQVDSGFLQAELDQGRVHGDIALALSETPVFVRLRTPEDRIRISVGPDSLVSVPEAWGLELLVDLERRDQMPVAGDYELTLVVPSTEELEGLPLPENAVTGLPDLERLRVDAEGRVAWDPTLAASAKLTVQPNAWMEAGRIHATWLDGVLVCDTLDVGLPDLRLTGSGSMTPDSLHAGVRARILGTRWMSLLQPEAAPPDSLVADVRAFVSGPLDAPRATARVTGGVRSGAVTVAPLELDAALASDRTGTFRLRARSMDLWAGLDGDVAMGDQITAQLSALHVVDALRTNRLASGDKTARVTFNPSGGDLNVESFRMTGELGELVLTAALTDLVNGTVNLDWRLDRAPSPLLHLLRDRPDEREMLADAWQEGEPVYCDLDITSARRDSVLGASIQGDFRLPGPRRLRALLPEDADVEELGPILGALELELAPGPNGPAFATRVDLSATEWVDALRVVAHGSGNEVTVDSLAVVLEGVRVRASGTVGDELDLIAFADVDSLPLVRRILGLQDEGLEARLDLDARIEGPRSAPIGHLSLEGSGNYLDHSISSLSAETSLDQGRVDALVNASADLAGGQLQIDSARLAVTSTADSLFPAHIDLTVEGPDLGLRQRVEIRRNGGWEAAFDTLALRLRGADFRNEAPFSISVNNAADSLHVDGLNLSGSLGRIRIDGGAGPGGADLLAEVDVDLPDTPPSMVTLPPGLEGVWPDSVIFNARAEGTANMRSHLEITGIDYGGKENLSFALNLSGGADGVHTDLRLGSPAEALLTGELEGPGSVSVYPPSVALVAGDLRGEIRLQNLPLPLSPQHPDLFAMGNGHLEIGGTPATPSVGLQLGLTFPQWKKLADHRFDLEVRYGQSGVDSSLAVDLSLKRGSASLMTGNAEVPLRLSLLPTLVEASAETPMHAEIKSEWIPLADFDELLPSDLALTGALKLDLLASGARESLAFDGGVSLRNVEARVARSARAVVAGRLDVGGTLDRPSIRGELELKNGVIQIPEQKRSLHPVSGTAKLWENTAWAADLDSLVLSDTLSLSDVPPLNLDLDVRVVIPGGLWIRGRDMELELEGDLRVVQEGAQPVVTGKLRARRGDFRFVGRRFTIDRGDVFFYGGDEINPSLDLRLKSEIDNWTFWVAVTGTALEPRLKLTSEPEALSEGDIMCFLVFGQRCDELDSGQGDLVGRMAAGFASAELTQALSGEFGVDMMSINVGDSQSSTSVTVGKYLSTRLLLKYEQALDSSRDFFLNLEYSLTRNIKLTTLAGSRQSGAEIRWSVDY